MYTEEEAKKKFCPFAFNRTDGAIQCEASDCVVWRWSEPSEIFGVPNHDRRGYCGLAGKPEE